MSEKKKEKEVENPSKRRFKSICVFSDIETGKNGEFVTVASDLGNALAARKINLVYAGGIQGLRGSTAISASIKGSKVLAVVVKELDEKVYSIGNELRVSSMPERMGCMLYNADAFIALPGGLETLEGISSIAYWAKLNFHQKPLGLLNVKGFYDGLLLFLDHAVEQGFIPGVARRAIISAPTVDQLIDQLQLYTPGADPPVKQINWQPPDGSKRHKPDTTLRL